MDYDDNEFQGQNRQLAGEGCSKVSPVLHTYALPKFDFDDTLNGHLNFNSLSENDVFLGITNQEDNQWIEQYSCGSSEIDFNSSTVESRHNNVWSEATSSESVEMLLKSVGQEEKVVKETIIKNLDICNETGSLTEVMDPNLNQESQKNQLSGGELNLVVLSEKHNLSVLEEKVENTFDDVIQKEENLVNESMVDNPGSSENADASIEELKIEENKQPIVVDASGLSQNVSSGTTGQSIKSKENSMSDESYTYNTEKSLSFVPNAESVENPSAETSHPFSENPTQMSKSEDHDSPVSNAGSLTNISPVQISSVKENENAIGKDAQHVYLEKKDAILPVESSDVDIEVVHADSQKNVEPTKVIAYSFESVVPVLIEGVTVSELDKRSSPDTSDGHATAEADDQPKSPIFGVSLVHHGTEEKVEIGFPSEGNSQNEILQVESVVASGSENPTSLVENEAYPDLHERVVHVIDVHCVPPVESCNTSEIETKTVTKNGGHETGNNPQTGGVQDTKELAIAVNESNKHQTFVDVARPSEIRAKDKQEATEDVTHNSSLPSKIIDDVENKVQLGFSGRASEEEKNFTFEVNNSAVVGQAGKSFHSYPTFQVSNLPKVTEGPSKDSSSSQMDAKKSHEVSGSPQNPSGLTSQIGVKGKSERKPRRKSAGKENAKKNHPKEIIPARDLTRGEISAVLLTPPATGQVTHFEAVKSHENATKPGGVLSSPKLPDLNNSTSIFQQPFTDSQQVQLRAQILVYGSLISGSPPEEPHMIAAFGQSDGGRNWEGIWRACLERLHVQKSQPRSNTPMQPRSDLTNAGGKVDQGSKHPSLQNKIPSSPIGAAANHGTPPNITPMIPLSSPLWNISTPSNNLQSSGMSKTSRLDYHLPVSPLHPFQTPTVQNFSALNPSWLSQGPFAGPWLAASPIPSFNETPCFLTLPTNESVKLTPVKESGGPGIKHAPTMFPEPAIDSKNKKRKKGTSSLSPQNVEKVGISEESLTKVEEAKLQAEEANKHAAYAASLRNGVWSQLERRYIHVLNSDDEAKLVSSAVSSAAAASVAKVAAAAAKIASDVADQAKSMVNAFLLNKSQNVDHQSNMSSLVNRFDKATPDAILKAAELAAEAVSQAGKIVAMSEPMPLRDLVEAGPEGYWKVAGNLTGTKKKNVDRTPEVSDKGNLFIKSSLSGKGYSGDFAENQTMEPDVILAPCTSHEMVKRKFKPRVRKGPEMSNTIEAVPEPGIGSISTSIVGQSQTEPKVSSSTLKESNIKEGCLVEVYKDDNKYNGAWFGANVLSLKDGKALVSYTEIQSDEGQLKEWVPLEVEGTKLPKIRVAHPLTTMRLEGTRKRRRTASTDFVWSSGDRVDVWIQDRWREGVVKETNKIDVTSLTVQFPAQEETSVVRSWFVRPTLVWKDGKWIECHTSDKSLSSQGDLPQEKRLKLASPVVESKRNDGPSESIDHVDLRKQEESRTLSLSTHESLFSVGSTRDNKKLATHNRTMKSSMQKEGPRVVFGVPKPGKKQKFMDVSKHYVADVTKKINTPHDSIKFTKYLIPQAPGSRGWKNSSREKPDIETKSRVVKSRKPPVPARRPLTFPKSTTHKNNLINKASLDSVSDSENQSDHQNQMDIGSSSNIEDALSIPAEPQKKGISMRSNKRKFTPTSGKAAKVEKSLPEVVDPRRSNRKIQPTSRLLEGLQSSISISKIPAASRSTPRSHGKVTPKGNMNNA